MNVIGKMILRWKFLKKLEAAGFDEQAMINVIESTDNRLAKLAEETVNHSNIFESDWRFGIVIEESDCQGLKNIDGQLAGIMGKKNLRPSFVIRPGNYTVSLVRIKKETNLLPIFKHIFNLEGCLPNVYGLAILPQILPATFIDQARIYGLDHIENLPRDADNFFHVPYLDYSAGPQSAIPSIKTAPYGLLEYANLEKGEYFFFFNKD